MAAVPATTSRPPERALIAGVVSAPTAPASTEPSCGPPAPTT